MKQIANILYLEFSELVEVGISEAYIWNSICKGYKNFKTIADPSDQRKVLIELDTLIKPNKQGKNRYKELIFERYGDPLEYYNKQLQQAGWQKALSVVNATTINYLPQVRNYCWEAKELFISDAKISELAEAAAWYNFISKIRGKKQALVYGYGSKSALIKACLSHWKIGNNSVLNKLSNVRYLQDKVKVFTKEGIPSLISGKYGNKNTQKIGGSQAQYLLQLAADPRKFNPAQIHAFYTQEAEVQGWEFIHESSVYRFLAQPNNKQLYYLLRHGKKAFNNKFEQTIHRKPPSLPHRLWVMDGSPLELYYRTPKGKPARIYGFMVADARSWAVLGIAFGKTETQALVFDALRDAATRHGVLGEQLLFDNSSAIKAHDMLEWYKRSFKVAFPAEVGNAKTKILEPLQKHINEQVFRMYPNYAGAGVKAKRINNAANDEWLLKNIKHLPDLETVKQTISYALFEQWNNRPFKNRTKLPKEERKATPNQIMANRSNPHAKKLELWDMISVFWKFRMEGDKKEEYTLRKGGIEVTINGETNHYRVKDEAGKASNAFWWEHAGEKFNVKYDPQDLSMIALYKDDKQIELAQTVWEAPMAVADYEEGDALKIRQRINGKKAHRTNMQELAEGLEMVSSYNEIAAETDLKLPIANKGNYKNGLNDAEERYKTKGMYHKEATFEIFEQEN